MERKVRTGETGGEIYAGTRMAAFDVAETGMAHFASAGGCGGRCTLCCGVDKVRLHVGRNPAGWGEMRERWFCQENTGELDKQLKRFSRFVSRQGMNIPGFSKPGLEKLIVQGLVREYADIYQLCRHKGELERMEGFGRRSSESLLRAIDQSRGVRLENFITALGIPLIGFGCARDIAEYFHGDYRVFEAALWNGFDFTVLNAFRSAMVHSLTAFYSDDELREEVDALLCEVRFITAA